MHVDGITVEMLDSWQNRNKSIEANKIEMFNGYVYLYVS